MFQVQQLPEFHNIWSDMNPHKQDHYTYEGQPHDLAYGTMFRQDSLSDLFIPAPLTPSLNRVTSIVEVPSVPFPFSPVLAPVPHPQGEDSASFYQQQWATAAHHTAPSFLYAARKSSSPSPHHVPVTFSSMDSRFALPQPALPHPAQRSDSKPNSRSSTPALDTLSMSEQAAKPLESENSSFKQPADRPVLRRNHDGSQSVPLMHRSIHMSDSAPQAQRSTSMHAPTPVPPTSSRGGRKRSRGAQDGTSAPVIPASMLEGLNKEEVKKIKHRSIDAFRRAREAAAVARLSSWLDSYENGSDSSTSSPPPPTAREKLAVLESSGVHLESLSRRVSDLETARTRLEDENALLKQQLHQTYEWMKQATAQGNSDATSMLRTLQNQSIIYRSVFECTRRAMIVLSVETGTCLAANPKFAEMCGLSVDDVMQTRYSWSLVELLALYNDATSPSPSQSHSQMSATNHSPVTRRMGLQQHVGNGHLLLSLLKGQKDHVECVFSAANVNGNDDATPVNVQCDCWLGCPSDPGAASNGDHLPKDVEPAGLLADIIARPFSYQLAISLTW